MVPEIEQKPGVGPSGAVQAGVSSVTEATGSPIAAPGTEVPSLAGVQSA
jgi:hypothetical protein